MECRIQQLSGALGVAGLLFSAVQNFTSIFAILNKHFWIVYGVAIAMSLYAFWPDREPQENLKIVPPTSTAAPGL
jgi:hypothetical protein